MDYEAALARLDRLASDIEAYVYASEFNRDDYEELENLDMKILEGVEVAQHVAYEVGMQWTAKTAYNVGHPERWDRSHAQLRRVRAKVATAEEIAQIKGPKGPSMSATGLHPAIWNAALDLWSNEHHREAVQAAATALDLMTSAKTGTNLSGKELFQEVFSSSHPKPGKARLRFAEIPVTEKHTWTNQHEGSRNLPLGAMQLIRNMTTHSLDPLDPNVAFEYLAVLSVVAR